MIARREMTLGQGRLGAAQRSKCVLWKKKSKLATFELPNIVGGGGDSSIEYTSGKSAALHRHIRDSSGGAVTGHDMPPNAPQRVGAFRSDGAMFGVQFDTPAESTFGWRNQPWNPFTAELPQKPP